MMFGYIIYIINIAILCYNKLRLDEKISSEIINIYCIIREK